MLQTIVLAIALALSSAADAAVSSKTDAGPNPPVRVVMTEEGPVFATSSGMTLYTYANDDGTPGKSQCLSVPRTEFPDPTAGFGTYSVPLAAEHKSCAEKWPPFLADAKARTGGEWTLIDRPEGKQWAYRGRPLYTSIKDRKPGDVNGLTTIGQLRGWRLAMAPLDLPPGLKLVRHAEGLVLATQDGRPLYTPKNGKALRVCDGCTASFEPVGAPAIANAAGDWTTVAAGAGRRQYVFKGQPLYVAPTGLSSDAIAELGEWRKVIYHKSAGTPSAIGTHLSLLGDVYTDKSGKTLYVFTCSTPVRDGVLCDDPGDAAAYWSALCGDARECSRRWRPYVATPDARDVGDWSVVEVADPMFIEATGRTYPPGTPRVKAWAYRGRPVYTYYMDQQPGDIWGHSLRWFAFSGFYALQVPGRGLLD